MRLAIFDFDGTLFPHQTIPYLMKLYLEAGYSKTKYLMYMAKIAGIVAKYKLPFYKDYGKEQFRRQATVYFIQLLNGETREGVEAFFKKSAEAIVGDLNPEVVSEVKKAKLRGEKCIVLSGCFSGILEGVAKALDMDYVIGTPVETSDFQEDELNVQQLDIATGHRKVEKLLTLLQGEEVEWEKSTAYGDSVYDRYILELVGRPVAVNPDEGLREMAEGNNWRILETS
ncbi:MAG: HAD family hydrolase [Cellulosilyticaceae bacterium]